MTKLYKKLTITILSALMAICAIFALANFTNYRANAEVTAITLADLEEAGTFKMDGGAQIRAGENKGLRFTASIPTDAYAGLVETYGADNLTFGSFVLPSAYVTGKGANPAIGTPSVETCFGASAVYTWDGKAEAIGTYEILHNVADKAVIESQGKVNGYVKEILTENLGISYLGYTYVKAETQNGSEYLFATQSVSNARSTILVAVNALDSGALTGSDLTSVEAYFTQYGKSYNVLTPAQNETAYAQADKLSAGTTVVLPEALSEVTKVFVNNKEISGFTYTDGDKTLVIPTTAIADVKGDANVVVEGTSKIYSGKIQLIDVITDVAGLEAMRASSGGYYALGADLNLSGVTLSSQSHGFEGTFDGRGYTISNLTYTNANQTLFFTIKGTVKNLVMTNVTLSGIQSGAVAVALNNGTIDNVFVKVAFTGNHSGGFVKWTEAGDNKIINSVVNVTSMGTGDNNGLIIAFGAASTTLDITNTYAIKPSATATIVGNRGDAYATFRDTMNELDTTATPKSFVDEYDLIEGISSDEITVNVNNYKKISSITLISTADEFATAMSSATRYQKFALIDDIDMKDKTGGNAAITPIATYSGVLNGFGHTVSNLIITPNGSRGKGLFNSIVGGTVKNFGLDNPTYASSSAVLTGILAGYIENATIDNVFVKGNISAAGGHSGALVGQISPDRVSSEKITNCVIVATIKATDATHGAIYGRALCAATIDLTGTYIIVDADSVPLHGSTNSATISGGTKYTLENFLAAGIDFSGYNAAITTNIAKLG